ncbi:helix-loop-helix protein delilah-like [Teleopsis dalmanni]|uniref:helix-loop-helix protein delilah-like n=1 Tax=Teleopsis dalmanni TaxID=139649 RepID=UPI0018CF8D31|nr:helix-loop-helix protein delilah-like [Teleopsis dalmanni]
MKEINQAFENLRSCVPTAITDEEVGAANEKLTKITTLRLAMKYISVLTEALNNDDVPVDDILECKKYGELNLSFDALQSVASRIQVAQPEKTLSKPTKVQNKNVAKLPANSVCRKNLSKRRQRKQTPRLVDIHENNKSKANRNVNNVNDSNYTQANTIADLTNLMLESDGESLHLSEHCLSPLQANYINLLESTEMATDLAANLFSGYESQPFELNLRLLEANAGALDIPMEQQLPLCSPMAILDTFDDLYDFPIHSSLDLFST